MDAALALSALTLGLVSTLHCVGMCGPLALAVPVRADLPGGRMAGLFSYHLGRIAVYAVLGTLAGLFGAGLRTAGLQQWLAIGSGLLLVGVGIAQLMAWKRPSAKGLQWYGKLHAFVRGFVQRKNHVALLVLGGLNGLLPCGMVYIALGAGLAAGSVGGSAAFMALFGLGTWPVLIALPLAGNRWAQQLKTRWRQALPWATVVLGVLLVLRGADLGIPFLSPATTGGDCCTLDLQTATP